MSRLEFTRDLGDRRWRNFQPAGNLLSASLSNDVTNTTTILNVTSEAHSLSAGAAGTTGTVRIADNAPIYNSTGTHVGDYSDTSLVITGTALTTEVEFNHMQSDAEQLAELADGEYAVDYVWGLVRYSKADATTSVTVDYTTRQMNTLTSGSSPTVTENVNVNKVAGTSTATGTGNVTAGTLRITIADDDTNLAAINTNIADIETILNNLTWTGDDLKVVFSNSTITVTATDLDVRDLDSATDSVSAVQSGTWDIGTITTITNDVNVVTNLDSFDFATETTLSNIDTNLTDVVDTSAHLVRVAEQDPIFNNFTPEVICDITNGTDGTYEFYTTGDTFNEVGTQLLIDGGSGTATVTVEVTAQDDGTAPASCTYVDVTNARFGAASFTASNYLFDTNKVLGQAKYIKYKVVLDTTGANDADVKIMIKKK